MIRALHKTFHRTERFLVDSIAWRGAERPYALVGWGLIAGLAWIFLDLMSGRGSIAALMPGQLFLLAVLSAVCAVDSRFGIIPDSLVGALAAGGAVQTVLASWLDGDVGFVSNIWGQATGPLGLTALAMRGIDMVIVFAAAALLRTGYRVIRGREGLGFGDVKFVAAATLWIGLAWVPVVVMAAVISALGSIAITRGDGHSLEGGDAIAFGPHLALGVWLAVLASQATGAPIDLP